MARGAARSGPGSLPAELTSFVGRRRELAEIKRLLTTTRLLTLTGIGGAGKTRLALRAASEVARNFPDGVWLVSLAPIDDPLLVTQAVFSALGLQDVSSRWSLSALGDYLRARRLLLVLDNCEHLLDAAAGLAGTLLKSCPELRILATSRQALGMPGELRLRVPALALPDALGSLSPGHLAGFDAVALFVERAAAVQSGFEVDDSNAISVLQLCRRLDGIPLALELAAGRMEGLTVDQLLTGLDRELSAPAAALRGGEARQRTMRATLDWSYSLLDEQQQRLWARLSAFAGGFSEQAAAMVCSSPDSPIEDFAHVLAALVESSIVQRDAAAKPPRYSMLETVRHYGRQKLLELGEELQLQTRHRDWIRELAGGWITFDREQPTGFKLVDLERDNIWSALDFCRRQPGEAAVGVQIAASLSNYWASRGPFRNVRGYFESILPLTEPDTPLRARCLISAAVFAGLLDDAAAAQQMAREAFHIAQEHGDADLAGWAAGALLSVAFVLEQADGVPELSQTMLEAGRTTENPGMVGIAMHYVSQNLLGQGRTDEAIAVGEEGLAMCREAGNLFIRGAILNTLAEARRRRGQLSVAQELAREGIECKESLDDRRGLAILIETQAWIASDGHDDARAAVLLGCASSLRSSLGIPMQAPFVRQHRACETATKERLGEAGFGRAFDRGAEMSVTEAIDYALRRTPAKPPATAVAPPSTALSRRELEIARLIAEGLTNKEVASKLFISNRTVETHVTNMLNKLGLSSRTQLARWVG